MKTKRHPGNLTLFFLFFSLPLLAAVKATVDNPAVYRGDPVTLTLSAEGDDIEFPPLADIAGYPVSSRGTSRNLSIVNGKTTRTLEQRLVFVPTKNVTIPSLDIKVDGTTEHTLPIHVRVLKPQAAAAGAPVQLKMTVEKNDPYVGEPVRLDLVVRMKPGTRIDDLQVQEPKFEHFWIKSLGKEGTRGVDDDGYITQTYSYLLFAQKSGTLEIPQTFAQIGTRPNRRQERFGDAFFGGSMFGNRLQYRKVYSDGLTLQVKPLPDNLELYGSFTLHSDIDKKTVQANQPVNLHIHIEGEGNVEDIKKFAPVMRDAVVYANDPVIKGYMKEGRYFGTFDQTIAVIPDRNMTIAPMTLRYFDKETQQVVTKQTPPYAIGVVGAAPKHAARVESAPALETAVAAAAENTAPADGGFNVTEAAGIFAAGALTGAASLWLLGLWRRERPERSPKETPIGKKIRSAKDDRALFELLLPFKGKDASVDAALMQLEANLYAGAKHRVDRKALQACFDGVREESVELL